MFAYFFEFIKQKFILSLLTLFLALAFHAITTIQRKQMRLVIKFA